MSSVSSLHCTFHCFTTVAGWCSYASDQSQDGFCQPEGVYTFVSHEWRLPDDCWLVSWPVWLGSYSLALTLSRWLSKKMDKLKSCGQQSHVCKTLIQSNNTCDLGQLKKEKEKKKIHAFFSPPFLFLVEAITIPFGNLVWTLQHGKSDISNNRENKFKHKSIASVGNR